MPPSPQSLTAALARLPHFPCAHLPTPLEPLPRLSAHLGGANLWIKRDDCTGLATGGNKARKLEYLVGDARAQNADTLITHGALQSNHVRQTAAAAALAGMRCEVLYEHRVSAPDADYKTSGNVLLTGLLGARSSEFADGTDMDAAMAACAEKIIADGGRPYAIPGGGSNAIGAAGYANCALELVAQSAQRGVNFSHVVHATGSAGTQAGLVAGAFAMADDGAGEIKLPFPILGIGVRLPRDAQEEKVFALSCDTAAHLGFDSPPRDTVRANCDYIGDGYGIPTAGMREAVTLLAQLEGILLDPVYAGKGMAGLIDLVRRGFFAADDDVVFVHTGGAAALFGYRAALAD